MIWLTWRQHRAHALATAVLLVALAVVLLLVGGGVHRTFTDTGLGRCLETAPEAVCAGPQRVFDARHSSVQFLLILVLVCPLLLGAFWGAPLVARELEQGTHRFVWTQGVSRVRWLVPKVAAGTAVVAATAGALAAVSSWLSHPFNEVFGARLAYGVFDVQGIVPVAYAVFAFALGVASGALTRRAVPAMLMTTALFVVTRAVVELAVRLRLQPTMEVSYPTMEGRPPAHRGDFPVSERVMTASGEVFSNGFDLTIGPGTVQRWCPDLAAASPRSLPSLDVIDSCVERLGLQTVQVVHPSSQFWTLQLLESSIYVGLAAGLLGFATWQLQRRIVA